MKNSLILFVVLVCSSIFSSSALSKEQKMKLGSLRYNARPELVQEEKSVYLTIGMSMNSAIAGYSPHHSHAGWLPVFGVRYLPDRLWQLGMTTQFRTFKSREESNTLSLFTVNQEFFRRVRLYHPFYLSYGFGFLYILPTREISFPLNASPAEKLSNASGGRLCTLCH